MPEWKQLLKKPAGAFPAAAIQKVGIAALTLVMIGLVLSSLWTGDNSFEGKALPGSEPGLTGAGQVAQLTSRLTDLQAEQQRQQERDAAAAREAEQADALAALLGGGAPAAGVTFPEVPPAGQPGDAPAGNLPPGAILTPDEIELRERLRLEGVERRARSLRAPALVQSFRETGAAGGIAPAAQTPAPGGGDTGRGHSCARSDGVVQSNHGRGECGGGRGRRSPGASAVGANGSGCHRASGGRDGGRGDGRGATRSAGMGAGV